ncbi:serine/threonine-protein kinase [Sorangium sp. So ce119]|uniref:serine/threonine-protein kinase n=1 Tax=Sorangium sp. So ce119 TaxID=3133279 RepID=UPI003F620DB7
MEAREGLPARAPQGPGAERAAPREGPVVGGHDVILEIASGGMATAYLARRAGVGGLERLVVLKRVHRHLLAQPEVLDMLRDEARIAALIRHPHVVSVEDVLEAGGELLLVMPYVEAVPLAALIAGAAGAGERLPPAVASRVVADVLAGLHAAHEARDLQGRPLEVVHRDVSPRNVLVGADGRSLLIDFGIAKAARRAAATRSGVLKGTFSYMAPEQLRGARDVDRRADLFAAGAVLHEALTGCRLFDGDDEASVLLGILADDIEAPSARAPGVPPELDRVVLRALAQDRDERFPTAADFLEALERALPPAPAREVAALVERHGGAALAARREAVRAWLEQAEAANARAAAMAGQGTAGQGAAAAAGQGTAATTAAQGTAAQGTAVTAAQGTAVTAAQATATQATRAPRRRAALVALGVLAPAAIGGALALAARSREATPPAGATPSAEVRPPAEALPSVRVAPSVAALLPAEPPSAAPAAAPASPGAASPGAASPSPTAVELRLAADAPIADVRAPGLLRVDRQGRAARIGVAPWSGTLLVEVALEGGGAAIARFEQDGPREARLRPAPTARPQRRPELHANPYR